MGNYFSIIQIKDNFLSKQKDTTDTFTKLIWYDIEEKDPQIPRESLMTESVYVEIFKYNSNLDKYTNIIYNKLISLISKNKDTDSYKLIKNYIIKYDVKFNELLEKRCMCYFLYWELRPFLKEQNPDLQYIFTRFQNRFGWVITDRRY